MKNLSVMLIALLLAAPVYADDVQTQTVPTSLNSISTNILNDAESLELSDLGAFLDKKVQEVSDLLSAKIAEELPVIVKQEAADKVSF